MLDECGGGEFHGVGNRSHLEPADDVNGGVCRAEERLHVRGGVELQQRMAEHGNLGYACRSSAERRFVA